MIPLNTSALEYALRYSYICKDLLVSKHAVIELRELDVNNLLWKSYRICCVTRQESIHAVALFPTREHVASNYYAILENQIETSVLMQKITCAGFILSHCVMPVSIQRQIDCLLNSVFRLTAKEWSKLNITCRLWKCKNATMIGRFISQNASNMADNTAIIVIAIGDYYRFAFFGLVTKFWLKFQGLIYYFTDCWLYFSLAKLA